MAKKRGLMVYLCVLWLGACASVSFTQGPNHISQLGHVLALQPGEIDGAVHAISGAEIGQAAVQVLRADGSTQATLNTDATGHFRVQVPPGTYAVIASRLGFVRLRLANVVVQPGSKVPLNFSLAVLPPSALAGAILHLPGSVAAVAQPAPKPAPLPLPPPIIKTTLAPAPAPPPQAEVAHPTAPKTAAAPQEEQVITMHPAEPAPAAAAEAPQPATEVPVDAASAQAKAAIEEEEQKQKAVQEFVKNLPKGLISYFVPAKMQLNHPVTVSVKIFGSKAPAAMAAAASAAGGTKPAAVPTSNYMQVYLSQEENPGAFAIEQTGDQSPKWVSSTSETDWVWIVTPKTTGTAKLKFQTLIMYPDKEGKLPQPYDVKDEVITVTTPSAGEYLHSAWDSFLTSPTAWLAYVLPGGTGFVIMVWLIDRFRKKKKEEKT